MKATHRWENLFESKINKAATIFGSFLSIPEYFIEKKAIHMGNVQAIRYLQAVRFTMDS